MWTAPVTIEGLNQGATFDINENGKYVLKPCITCKKQKQMKADSQRFVGGVE
jgi:hypothetical protein